MEQDQQDIVTFIIDQFINRLGLMDETYPFGPVLVIRESVDDEGESHYESLTDDEISEILAPVE